MGSDFFEDDEFTTEEMQEEQAPRKKRTKKQVFIIAIASLLVAVLIASGLAYIILRFGVSDGVKLEFSENNLLENAEFTYSGAKPDTNWYKTNGIYWRVKDKFTPAYFTASFEKPEKFNTVYFEEDSDAVYRYRIYAKNGDAAWEVIYEGDRIGGQNIVYTEEVTATDIRVEVLERSGELRLETAGVYFTEKKDLSKFTVTSYLKFDGNNVASRENDPDFTGYFGVLTDVVVYDSAYIDENGEVVLKNNFASNYAALKRVADANGVNIWVSVSFAQTTDGAHDLLKTYDFISVNCVLIVESLEKFVTDNDIYGVNFNWN
ncbi:MAG: hypothetical protein LBN25_02030, partial [Christensenellaceae bacterium]|nr:hypothetical protein [Christensenellaceae bacterium]